MRSGATPQGNIYYVARAGRRERRWVIYNGEPEASRVPPEWHLWLHKTVDTTPDEAPLKARVWEKPWVPNLTGTPAAHRPSGQPCRRRHARQDDRRLRSMDTGIRCAALFKDNVVEALVGLLVVVVALWFVGAAYARTDGERVGSGYLLTARFP